MRIDRRILAYRINARLFWAHQIIDNCLLFVVNCELFRIICAIKWKSISGYPLTSHIHRTISQSKFRERHVWRRYWIGVTSNCMWLNKIVSIHRPARECASVSVYPFRLVTKRIIHGNYLSITYGFHHHTRDDRASQFSQASSQMYSIGSQASAMAAKWRNIWHFNRIGTVFVRYLFAMQPEAPTSDETSWFWIFSLWGIVLSFNLTDFEQNPNTTRYCVSIYIESSPLAWENISAILTST